ncbi:hypothetical protein DFH28DRAFT_890673 [Melampsora americana]|nr:hypothetical protein DFH28DRAFT_890673 [Melampsora americana]
MYIQIPSTYSQEMSTLLKRAQPPSMKLFCQKSGGKAVSSKDFTCTKPSQQTKPTQPSCKGSDGGKKVRGTLECSNGGQLQIRFRDCNSGQGAVSCKAGASAIALKKSPEIKCRTRGGSPKDVKPQCHPEKGDQTGKFSGKIKCPDKTDLSFRSGKGVAENPCKSKKQGQGAPVFCTPNEWV